MHNLTILLLSFAATVLGYVGSSSLLDAPSSCSFFTKSVSKTKQVVWTLAVNKDCHLILNDAYWGILNKDTPAAISLQLGEHTLEFKKHKDGSVIKKQIIFVESNAGKTLNVILPGEVTIRSSSTSNKPSTPYPTPRRLLEKCEEIHLANPGLSTGQKKIESLKKCKLRVRKTTYTPQ
jgi:hypothetical protein